MKARRHVFDAHFHIGPWGTREFARWKITPIPDGEDHQNGDDCAAYLKRYGIKSGLIVPTYLERQSAAFEYNRLLLDAVERHKSL